MRSETVARIRENYTINLLDDMWVLMGFENTADEYSTKINDLMKERRRLENQYLVRGKTGISERC
jgi:DNA sulfur modification protein DndD